MVNREIQSFEWAEACTRLLDGRIVERKLHGVVFRHALHDRKIINLHENQEGCGAYITQGDLLATDWRDIGKFDENEWPVEETGSGDAGSKCFSCGSDRLSDITVVVRDADGEKEVNTIRCDNCQSFFVPEMTVL